MSARSKLLDYLDKFHPQKLGTTEVIGIADKAVELFGDNVQRTELHALCERAILALHMHSHAGINKPGFMQCREGLCRDYHRMTEAR